MPKYIFNCPSCKANIHRYVPSSVETYKCPTCDSAMNRQFPNTNAPTEVRELVDPYTNITWGKDHEAVMKDRKETHYWEVEVPRLVQTYSIETCLEQGWLIYNDKGELVINKPPSKR
jgi:hypothetical protein